MSAAATPKASLWRLLGLAIVALVLYPALAWFTLFIGAAQINDDFGLGLTFLTLVGLASGAFTYATFRVMHLGRHVVLAFAVASGASAFALPFTLFIAASLVFCGPSLDCHLTD